MIGGERPLLDLRDIRLALREVIAVQEWILVREKARLGPADVAIMLKRLKLARDVISDEPDA